MGEGWGDYFGISLLADPGDDLDGNFALGAYSVLDLFGQGGNYYYGIRRFPFSPDMNVSPLTYADLDPAQFAFDGSIPANSLFIGNPANEVHNVGELWTQALLEARRNMILSSGFGANDGLMQLVVDGLKLQPNNPNFLDARDAILQADLVANGGVNLGDLWAGFAKRGMGANASSPTGGSSTSGIVEDFTVPALIFFDYALGVPDQLAPDMPVGSTVQVSGIGAESPTPGTGMLHVQLNGGGFTATPMTQTLPNVYAATLPAADCFDTVDFYFSVESTGGTDNDPQLAPADFYSAEVFTGVDVLFADDLEANLGWGVGAPDDDATTGIWERVDPVGTSAQPEIDVTDDPGVFAFVTGQGAVGGGLGDNDVDGGKTTLFSPLIDLSSGDARISYYRWDNNTAGAEPGADIFEVDISNDAGGPWSSVEVVGPGGPDNSGGWVFHEFLVSDVVAPTGLMLMRFVASDEAGGSIVEAGIDELSVNRLVCEACQENVGFAGPGLTHLSVCGDPLTPGGSADVKLEGAPTLAPALAVFGFSSNPTPILGGTLVPFPPAGTSSFVTDGVGELFLPGAVSSAIGPADVFLQFLVVDPMQAGGVQFSNAVRLEFLP